LNILLAYYDVRERATVCTANLKLQQHLKLLSINKKGDHLSLYQRFKLFV
jgi:hypothetical protein